MIDSTIPPKLAVQAQPELKALTQKEANFIELYLQTWNVVTTMRLLNETGDEKDLSARGRRLLRKPNVQAVLAEKLRGEQITANEITARLSQMARLNVADFYNYKTVVDQQTKQERLVVDGINWDMIRNYGFLVKGISYDRSGRPVIEFHDSQAAMTLLGKVFKMFSENTINTNVDVAVKVIQGVSMNDL